MQDDPKDPDHLDHEDEQDDAVIGHAFRRSLILLTILAAAVLLLLWWRARPTASAPEQAIERTAPETPARGPAGAPQIPFADVTSVAGIDFVHENGARGDKLLPESMGAGVTIFDHDGDGDGDLFLTNGRPWESGDRATTGRLYRNDSTPEAMRFTDVTAAAGLDRVSVYGTSAAVGDADGDGRNDLFITAVGGNLLLLGQPDGRYEDVTAAAGVAGSSDAWSSTATFFDADRDGDLDLFVGNYVRWSRDIDFEIDYRLTGVGRAYGPPVNYQGSFSYLYRNDSTPGAPRFTDVSEAAGIRIENEVTGVPVGKALGLLPIDADGDGWTDLLVANDTVRNFFFRNRATPGKLEFEEVGELWGVAYGRAGEATGAMGVDAGFVLGTEDLGFAIGNFANEMTSLYLAQGDRTLYADDAIGLGVGAPSRSALTFGVLLLDVDLDGRLDLLQTNGHLESEINTVDPSQRYAQPSQLFWNAGGAERQPLVTVSNDRMGDLAQAIVGRGSATADLDGDGDLDVVMTETGGPVHLLRNDQATGHHWLRVHLHGAPPNAQAFGARVVLEAGSVRQVRQVNPTRSYASQSETILTFGLGQATTVDALTVIWPDGSEQTVLVDGVDRLLRIEGTGRSPNR